MPTLSRPHVRWLVRRDLAEVLAIDAASFDSPWTEDDFLRELRERDRYGYVAEDGDGCVAGFLVCRLAEGRLDLLRFAVAPDCRRVGVGRAMQDKLEGKLHPGRRTRVVLRVRESNLAAQLFWRRLGYRAVRVERGHYGDTGEDAYIMVYSLAVPARQEAIPW